MDFLLTFISRLRFKSQPRCFFCTPWMSQGPPPSSSAWSSWHHPSILCHLCQHTCLWPHGELVEDSDQLTPIFVSLEAAQYSANSRNSTDALLNKLSVFMMIPKRNPQGWETKKEVIARGMEAVILASKGPGTGHHPRRGLLIPTGARCCLGSKKMGIWDQDFWIQPEASEGCSLHVEKSRRTPHTNKGSIKRPSVIIQMLNIGVGFEITVSAS